MPCAAWSGTPHPRHRPSAPMQDTVSPCSLTRLVPAVVFRESVVIGETSMSSDEVNQMVTEMGLEFKGSAYHLLQRNCNHFSDAIITRLCGRHPPSWVSCRCRRLCAHSHAGTCFSGPASGSMLEDLHRVRMIGSCLVWQLPMWYSQPAAVYMGAAT